MNEHYDAERYWQIDPPDGRLCFGPYSDTTAYCQICAKCWKEIRGDIYGDTFYKSKTYHHECAYKLIKKDQKEYNAAILADPKRAQYQILKWQKRERKQNED